MLDEQPSLPFLHSGLEKSCGRSPLTRYGALIIVSLEDIALEAPELYTKAAAYAFMGYSEMAQVCLSRCSESERRQIEGYPISRFFVSERPRN